MRVGGLFISGIKGCAHYAEDRRGKREDETLLQPTVRGNTQVSVMTPELGLATKCCKLFAQEPPQKIILILP